MGFQEDVIAEREKADVLISLRDELGLHYAASRTKVLEHALEQLKEKKTEIEDLKKQLENEKECHELDMEWVDRDLCCTDASVKTWNCDYCKRCDDCNLVLVKKRPCHDDCGPYRCMCTCDNCFKEWLECECHCKSCGKEARKCKCEERDIISEDNNTSEDEEDNNTGEDEE